MIRRSRSRRVSTAALIFATISPPGITALPAKWQQQCRAWDKHVEQFMARHVAHHCSVLCRFFERADLLYHDGFVLAGRADPDKKHANVCGFGQAAGDTATGALE